MTPADALADFRRRVDSGALTADALRAMAAARPCHLCGARRSDRAVWPTLAPDGYRVACVNGRTCHVRRRRSHFTR